MTPKTAKTLHRSALLLGMLIVIGVSVQITKADPLLFSNVSALQNGGLTKVDLFSNPGTTILGKQITFSIDVTGTLGAGQVDTLRVIYNEQGGQPIVQDIAIPVFGTIQPPFTLMVTFTSAGANFQGIPATLSVDLLNSSPDFIIPDGLNEGQQVNSYTYSFKVAQPVPEPATLIALASGLVGLGIRPRRRG